MKKSLTVIGVVLILLGVAAIIHPGLPMPSHKTEVQIVGRKIDVETQRIVEIPVIWSALVIVAGAGLVLLGMRKT
jgi:hypothetical protein